MQICYAMMAYMKYANAPSKLQCEFLQHNISVCVIYKILQHKIRRIMDMMQMRGESPPFKEKWMVEIIGKKFDQGWSMKEEAICVHKNPPMGKKKALTFENGMNVGELKLF